MATFFLLYSAPKGLSFITLTKDFYNMRIKISMRAKFSKSSEWDACQIECRWYENLEIPEELKYRVYLKKNTFSLR